VLQLSKVAAERNESLCNLYRFRIGHESPSRLVFIDESRIDCRTTYRLNGWAQKGKKATVKARFVRGTGCVSLFAVFFWFSIDATHTLKILTSACPL
jgi:hypothetical protein